MSRVPIVAAAILLPAAAMCAAGSLSGRVTDSGGRPLPGAEVSVQSQDTGARWKAQTGADGTYEFAGLPPAGYKVTARNPGFRTVSRFGMEVRDAVPARQDFVLHLIELHQVITVTTGRDEMDPSSVGSLLVTRNSPGASLPVNGRDFREMFDLMPGVTITPARAGDAGQFTSGGQRPNSNAFRMDGISANTGVGGSVLPGSFPGASLPAMTAIGSTENFGTPETVRSVELRTSNFAPESGERPGAETLVTSRSGSNEFHGDLFGRVRDNSWSARDWFANSRGIAYARPSYDNLGAVIGGPLQRNRTFFLFSAEDSHLTDTGLQLTSVPSLAARADAPEAVRPILNWFAPPTGPEIGGGEAEGLLAGKRTAALAGYSLRLDRSIGQRGTAFLRAGTAPSSSRSEDLTSSQGDFRWQSATAGITLAGPAGTVHDFRFNFSRAGFTSRSYNTIDTVSPLAQLSKVLPSDLGNPLPPPSGLSLSVLGLAVPGLGQFVAGDLGRTRQDQWEVSDSISRQAGRHELRAGADYIHLEPSRDATIQSTLGFASSLQSVLEGQPMRVTFSQTPAGGGAIQIASFFAQDTFRAGPRLELVYGLRWEVTPPTARDAQIPTVSGLWNGDAWQFLHGGDINGAAPWPMRYRQLAPRLGIAYRIGGGLVFRAGAGSFYDPTLAAAIDPVNGAPFNSWQLESGGITLPAGGSGAGGPGPPFLPGPVSPLRLPVSYQWRASLERAAGKRGSASVSYAGSAGRNLLRREADLDPNTGVLDRLIAVTTGASAYHALQVRYTGSLSRDLFSTVAYTWSHSIDDGSEDSSIFLVHPGYSPREDRGSSNFDVRHALTAALSYRMPRWLGGWTLSAIARARSGFPIDIAVAEQNVGLQLVNALRPDLMPGVPIWIDDPSAAGRRRLNPSAFQTPAQGMPGTLGRNTISGNGLFQWDAGLRREFALIERVPVEISVSAFNVLNRPAFADPVRFLSDPWFGQSTSMQNLMLGSGSPNSGLPPLFQPGGSRSVEFGFRVSF